MMGETRIPSTIYSLRSTTCVYLCRIRAQTSIAWTMRIALSTVSSNSRALCQVEYPIFADSCLNSKSQIPSFSTQCFQQNYLKKQKFQAAFWFLLFEKKNPKTLSTLREVTERLTLISVWKCWWQDLCSKSSGGPCPAFSIGGSNPWLLGGSQKA